ncbi:hypothetical protein ACH79_38555 [Bradyrhizobium sp. CCBAU 051011]|uniref:ATP-dependent DNA ligase n=1 Tax=Bradyrhizobium sp. CCBAU 051011 TaxID=858422 RepID=UPI0013740680|nr:hypothetical protein [Bradyrhizobium sp. CCBAU 051011]QHO77659.1 hypothetical protein ACH79_38555 [Bradyrhizobium sp. CCBAU 051011]
MAVMSSWKLLLFDPRDDGLSDFNAPRSRRRSEAVLIAFDLMHQGTDLRETPLIYRKQKLTRLLDTAELGIQFNDHLTENGEGVFQLACRMGLEGIVSKQIDAPYQSGSSKTWLKSKTPASAAALRESLQDWTR